MIRGNLDTRHVLKLAAREFALHGFEAMSMRTLSDKCEISASTLYHHFGSKEMLYEEACSQAFDDIISEVLRRVALVSAAEEKLEQFVSALFDQWTGAQTTLLLTQRDVINTRTSPERCLAARHFSRFMKMIQDILSKFVLKEVDEHFVLTFGSLIFGYCSLISYEERESQLPPAIFLHERRTVLVSYCKQLWSMSAFPSAASKLTVDRI